MKFRVARRWLNDYGKEYEGTVVMRYINGVKVEVNGVFALAVQGVSVTVGDDGIDTQCLLI